MDSSTLKNNGVLAGEDGLPQSEAGVEGNGLVFDGKDDFVEIKGVPQVPDSTPFNLEAVARPDGTCEGQTKIVDRQAVVEGYSLVYSCTAFRPVIYVSNPGTSSANAMGALLPGGSTASLSALFDGSFLSLYSDEVASAPTNLTDTATTTSATFRVGAESDISANFFRGLIDSVRLMSRAFSPDEFLHYPMAEWALEPCDTGGQVDTDCDGEADVTDCDPVDPDIYPGSTTTVCGKDADCDDDPFDAGEKCDDGNTVDWDGCKDCGIVEFQVNTYTTSGQGASSVETFADGSFVIAWQSFEQDGSEFGVFGQRFSPNGQVLGPEFQINEYTTGVQSAPRIAGSSDGRFVVVWVAWEQEGNPGYSSYGQRFDKNGEKVGPIVVLPPAEVDSTYAAHVNVEMADVGSFVIVWVGYDDSGSGIWGQRYNSSGEELGSVFPINTYSASQQYFPWISMHSDGSFVIVWESNGQDGSGYGVHGQRFATDGSVLGSEFQVNDYTIGDQNRVTVSTLKNGGFVVAWQSTDHSGLEESVRARIFDSNGDVLGEEFPVGTDLIGDLSTNYIRPSIAAFSDGGFLIAWTVQDVDGSAMGVFAQRYHGNGTKDGTKFQVNTFTTSNQHSPSVRSFSDDRYIITWSSYQDGDDQGVFAQRFNADGIKIYK